MKTALINGFRGWKDYSGRSTRSDFWWFYLAYLIAGLVSAGILTFIFLPLYIAVLIRRMHDVGKSGWFLLVPLYNFYLLIQPPFEQGRIPKWILAERVVLGLVGLCVVGVISERFSGASLYSLILYLVIYLLIRRKNNSDKKQTN
jgi:uncharacterized membrane protein YhaH (DUF805 family)